MRKSRKPITDDEWVRKLNRLASAMLEIESSIQPTSWKEEPDLQKLKEQWKKLAQSQ